MNARFLGPYVGVPRTAAQPLSRLARGNPMITCLQSTRGILAWKFSSSYPKPPRADKSEQTPLEALASLTSHLALCPHPAKGTSANCIA